MRLTIIGCSGSFPGPDSPASCYLVEAGGFRLLLDLGSGALGALQRYLPLDGVDAVCLSHLHGDHCLDLCGYSVARTYHPGGPMPRIPVYGPAGTAERMARALSAAAPGPAAAGSGGSPAGPGLAAGGGPTTADDPGHGMSDAFHFVTVTPGVMEIGPLRVTAARMSHPVETLGFRLEHRSASLAYSADTGPSDALVELARGADLVLCEASFREPEAAAGPRLPPDLHLTGRQAGEHAAMAGAGALVLTHLVPWNDPEATLAEAAQAYRGELSLAAPGRQVTVS